MLAKAWRRPSLVKKNNPGGLGWRRENDGEIEASANGGKRQPCQRKSVQWQWRGGIRKHCIWLENHLSASSVSVTTEEKLK